MALAPNTDRLPVPPIPPSNPPPGADPTQDELSPTFMLRKYLTDRGFNPNDPANMRRALEANQGNPGNIGMPPGGPDVVPGLRSDVAGVDPAIAARSGGPGSARPPSSAGSSGTFGPGQSPIEGGPTANPSASDGNNPIAVMLSSLIGPLAAYGGYKYLNRNIGGGDVPKPNPDVSAPPTNEPLRLTDERTRALPAPPRAIAGPPAAPEASVARPGSTIPTPGPTAPPPAAVAPATPNYTGNMPPVDPNAIGNYRPGPSSSTAPPEPLPFRSQSPRMPPAAPITLRDLATSILRLHK